jgi:branched-chain amino acid transport system substrate-binding protein
VGFAGVHRRAALSAVVVIVCAPAPALAGCTLSAADPPKMPATITIGLLAPASGNASAASRPAIQGAQLAADVVNVAYPALPLPLGASAGLTLGSKISLVVADTTGDAGVGAQVIDELVRRSHPAGVVVADSTDVVKRAGQRAEDALIPLVDAGTSAGVPAELDHEWYFRVGPSDRALLSTALAALRQDSPTARRIVVLDGASGASLGGAPDLPDVAQSRGFTVVSRLPIAAAVDLPDRIGAQKPDAVIALPGTEQETAVVNDAMQRLKSSVPVVALGHGVDGLATGVGGRGMLRTAGWSSDYAGRNPVARVIGEMYQHRFGAPMDEAAANAFTAVLTLAVAIDKAGTPDTTVVRTALRQIDLPAIETIMPWDGVQFDSDGQNLLAAGVVEQWVGNRPQIVYPRELALRGAA